MTESDAEAKSDSESKKVVEMFKKSLDVDEDVATILAQEGFSTIEELAYVPVSELANIAEFDEDMVKELRNRARDVLLTQAIASEESLEQSMPADDLLQLSGMSPDLALALARKGVRTREQLAEQSIDDLSDIEGLDGQEAGALIMRAREIWFQAGQVSAENKLHGRCHCRAICRRIEGPGGPPARSAGAGGHHREGRACRHQRRREAGTAHAPAPFARQRG